MDLPPGPEHMSARWDSFTFQDQAHLQGLSKSQNRPCSGVPLRALRAPKSPLSLPPFSYPTPCLHSRSV